MGETKNRSIRLDDEVYEDLQKLGKTVNDGLRELLAARKAGALGEPTTLEGAFPEDVRGMLEEALELLRSAPQLEDMGTLIGHLLTPRNVTPVEEKAVVELMVEQVKKNVVGPNVCKHCGANFLGPTRYATICAECKSTGHTLTPAECPRCTEGAQL